MEELKNIENSVLSNLFPEEIIKRFLSIAIDQDKSIAVWSRPESQSFEIALDLSHSLLNVEKFNLDELNQGFMLAPFNYPQTNGQFIKADLYWNGYHQSLKDNCDNSTSNAIIKKLEQSEQHQIKLRENIKDTEYKTSNKSWYTNAVDKAIDTLNKNQDTKKVVLSRTKKITSSASKELHNLFVDSMQKYPYSFNYLIYTPTTGVWFGATPEVLFNHDENNMFETMALAGTQSYDGGSLKDATWTQKEIEEQALVSRYIINCFKKIRLREFDEFGPKTSMAGNLMHLRTDFNVDMSKVNFPELPNVMLDLLHPTSAVCGMPKDWSKSFISQHESHDRELYSGFLGPINFDLGSSAYVNLRCCKILPNEAILFAGAGITADSDSEKEFLETEMKFNTIQNLLK